MAKIEPYWSPKRDMSDFRFSMRKEKREGYFDVSEVPEAILPFFSFIYLVEGEVLLEIEGQTWLCQSGQILMVPRNVPFKVLYFKENVSFECGFSIHFLKDVSYECLHDPHPLLQTFQPEDAAFTAALLEQMLAAWKRKDYGTVASALDLFLCRLNVQEGHPGNPTVNQFLERVFDRSRKLGKVSDYAGELCITPNYLNRLIRNQTGHSAMDWIEISRLNLAKSLLKQGDLQIAEIATAVGIDDQSYFTRFFKKNQGLTPSQFREAVLKGKKKDR
ncbi:MAG: AraC family transcriptional regulator [Bacteroidales bacterium]|nr:AraC family transcriptional regulator [Bacteroidales bacterium]